MDYRLFDMHCHLDFLADPRGFAFDACKRGMGFFCATVTPAGFRAARESLGDCPNVHVGVGLHPWWLHDGRCGQADVDAVCRLAGDTRFVGEVGLDFGKRCVPSREVQLAAFTQVAQACAREGGKLLSVHAVRSADAVLDILDRTGCLGNNQVIFHWFSDSSQALTRAIRAGCSFSVNARMLATKRGREYAKAIPKEHLLLETDLPPDEEPHFSLDIWEAELQSVAHDLSTLRGEPFERQLLENSLGLIGQGS